MTWRESLRKGVVIPAHPLALTAGRKLDERRQRALTRYYLAAGAGGVAAGVHTTQFAIHDPRVGLYRPVLELAMEELRGADAIRVAGIVGATGPALAEARLARDLGYHAGLVSMAALPGATEAERSPKRSRCSDSICSPRWAAGFCRSDSGGGWRR